MQLKLKLDAVANIVIIVAGVALVGHLILIRMQPLAQPTYKTGDILPATAFDYARSPRTVFLFFSDSCPHCKASIPFYRRISQTISVGHGGNRLVILVAQASDVPGLSSYFRNIGVEFDSVLPIKTVGLRLRGTPTLLLADAHRRVLGIWSGRLQERDEAGVLRAVAP